MRNNPPDAGAEIDLPHGVANPRRGTACRAPTSCRVSTDAHTNTTHHRKSIRLPGYDYSREGAYFITICTADREWLFGKIENGEMHLNEFGKIVWKIWDETPSHFPHISMGEFVVMPNHVHGIIFINEPAASCVGARDDVGARHAVPLHVANETMDGSNAMAEHVANETMDGSNAVPKHVANEPVDESQPMPVGARHAVPLRQTEQFGKPTVGTIPTIVRSFKSAVTKMINEQRSPIHTPIWQRNYWEHIIRNENSFKMISTYIINNPIKWETDKLYSGGKDDPLRIRD
jgi:REP element-mobilizing transposase RayT